MNEISTNRKGLLAYFLYLSKIININGLSMQQKFSFIKIWNDYFSILIFLYISSKLENDRSNMNER
jgi:hypothetical protein